MDQKHEEGKLKQSKIIVHNDEETKRLERKEKKRKFWYWLVDNDSGLGGKKGSPS